MDKYIFDTNIFINAHRQFFPIDFCPAFWSFLERLNQNGEVYSIENVWLEIVRGNEQDLLKEWAKEHKSMFLNIDAKTAISVGQIIGDLQKSSYGFRDSAIAEFAEAADSFVVAFAKENEFTVVSHEVSSKASISKKHIKIPDICSLCKVPYISIYQLFAKKKDVYQFVLKSLQNI